MLKFKTIPQTITFSGEEFIEHSKKVSMNENLMNSLRKEAYYYLSRGGYSVTKRKTKIPGMMTHDYGSFGPYWWPDPKKEDGLPYIRRDGEINPETVEDNTFLNMYTSIMILTLAAYYLEDPSYAKAAVRNLKMWYLDSETYMTPHLKFGQGIPGIVNGRCFGLIDTRMSFELFDAVEILYALGLIETKIVSKLENWYDTFTNWMLTDEIGIDENRRLNNHGVWYDVQMVAQGTFLKREQLTRLFHDRFEKMRLVTQIGQDGAQKEELERTNALSYSTMNLEAMLIFGKICKYNQLSPSIFDFKDENGNNYIKLAADYLIPFFDNFKAFPYSQIGGELSNTTKAKVLSYLEKEYPGFGYGEKAEKLYDDTMLFRLLPR